MRYNEYMDFDEREANEQLKEYNEAKKKARKEVREEKKERKVSYKFSLRGC